MREHQKLRKLGRFSSVGRPSIRSIALRSPVAGGALQQTRNLFHAFARLPQGPGRHFESRASFPGHHFPGHRFSRASAVLIRCDVPRYASVRLEHHEPALEQLEQLAPRKTQLEPRYCSA
jgi:hypothetical protein